MSENPTGTQSQCPPETQSRRAKIICTIGPSCGTEIALKELMQAGMDVAKKQELRVPVLFWNMRLKLLENVQLGEVGLGFV